MTDERCTHCESCGEATAAAADEPAASSRADREQQGWEEALRRNRTCSVDEAARFLQIGRSTAYAAAKDGSLPSFRVAGRILVPVAKLLAMVGQESE
jgi:excisionase family DNA binding protein